MASGFRSKLVRLCEILRDPHHVASFQRYCGVRETFCRDSLNGHRHCRAEGEAADRQGRGEGETGDCNGRGDGEAGDRKGRLEGEAGDAPWRGKHAAADGMPNGLGKYVARETVRLRGASAENGDGGSKTPTCASAVKPLRRNSLTGDGGQEFLIENKLLYYLFTFGTELGNELFYITFFPFFIWNIDPYIGRRLILVWVWVMYLGQCTKDLIRWSRPASPPVVKVEMFYNSEYSMPSTHAMSGTAIPFSLFLLTYSRWEYPMPLGLALALSWCVLVCLSRIYMGMHSILDVIAGFLYSALILLLFYPALDVVDTFNQTCPYAPLAIISLHLGLGLFSFTLDTWSTSRGDTAQILGTGAGIALGAHLNRRLGLLPDPSEWQLPFSPPPISAALLARTVLRLLLGVVVLLATRAIMKTVTIPAVCRLVGVPSHDVREARQHMEVELPYRYIVYGTVGFNCFFLVPFLFSYVGLS
ncbi:sphingosine-1-phosphate phosphatase 1 [Brienomyrus brachyistius]|uniref:sphingosine-1-phosphate phosphatase 1 n=1 Tax=Brienomyrus brachyistius TaxID=42636 RepID=UPI0020B264E9|nr:sphingosine-1-phosphate phosphatase 1 [Brienomyrus brachyistius]